MSEEKKAFWSSLPGVITAIAGLVTAVAGLLATLGTFRKAEPPAAPTQVVAQPVEQTVAAPEPEPEPAAVSTLKLRKEPRAMDSATLDADLVRLGLFARDRSPIGGGVENRLEPMVVGDTVLIHDRATGLIWDRGSAEVMDAGRTEAYLARLNAGRYAGYANWRLPTMEEALSLMEPQPRDGYYLDPLLRGGPVYTKTADHTLTGRVWMVDYTDGVIGTEPPSHNSRVRAVR